LERLVEVWIDFWFLTDLRNKMLRNAGQPLLFSMDESVPPFKDFKQFLLGFHGLVTAQGVRSEDAMVSRTDVESGLGQPASLPANWVNKNVGELPLYSTCWTAHSRRVYQVSAELQGVLRATSLRRIRWQDVNWPFKSFAIAVEQPLPDLTGASPGIDFLLVYQYLGLMASIDQPAAPEDAQDEPILTIRGFNSAALNAYEPLTQAKRNELLRLSRNARRSTLQRLQAEWERLDAANCQAVQAATALSVNMARDNDALVEQFVRRAHERRVAGGATAIPEGSLSLYDHIARLVVGFALYLQSLPPNSSHVSHPHRLSIRGTGPDRLAILDEADVCTVSSVFTLTREEQVLLGIIEGEPGERARYELSCHFREWHMRRPKGQGKNPTARKTVYVRQTLVRRDRLPEGGAPGGSIKNV
jgi:hypothetical protein